MSEREKSERESITVQPCVYLPFILYILLYYEKMQGLYIVINEGNKVTFIL